MRLLSQIWRVARAALLYMVFAMAVALTSFVVLPVLSLFASDVPDLLAQRCMHWAARLVRRVAMGLGVVRLRVDGAAALSAPGPMLIVANHPTKLDATMLVALMSQVDTVVEASWAARPLLGPLLVRAGHLRNDDAVQVVEEGVRRLRQGRRFVIFPEGSRSPAGALHPFQRGAARIALASGCDLLPVVIRCDPPIGLKGKAWYDIPEETPAMSITVGDPIKAGDFINGDETRGVAARKVTRALRDYFLRELDYADV